MAKLQSVADLNAYALRKLGSPVINIEVDATQVTDRLEDAIQMFVERHYDGVEETYVKITTTATDVTNGYFSIPDNIVAITALLEPSSGSGDESFMDMEWQFGKATMEDLLSGTPDGETFATYELTLEYIELMNRYFVPARHYTHNRATNRMYVHGATLVDGNSFIIKGYRAVVPDEGTGYAIDLYDDAWLKKYSTALIKQQWGSNLKKFAGASLPGGQEIKGQEIYDEATEEITNLLEEFSNTYELPLDMMMG